MPGPVVNLDEVLANPEFSDRNTPGGEFEATLGFVGRALQSKKLGATVTVVPAGKKAWPRHYHYANDEMFVVLEGQGTLHYGDETFALRAGDVVNIEAGTEIPFQIANTSDGDLKYLAISTLLHPDVFVYPDSDKIGVMAGGGPMREARGPSGRKLVRFNRASDPSVPYWDGEIP